MIPPHPRVKGLPVSAPLLLLVLAPLYGASLAQTAWGQLANTQCCCIPVRFSRALCFVPMSPLMESPTACNVLCGALQEEGCFMRTAGPVWMECLSHRCNAAGKDTTGKSGAPWGSHESTANSSRARSRGWQKEVLLRHPNQINFKIRR